MRAALRGSGIRLHIEGADAPRPLALLAREAACVALRRSSSLELAGPRCGAALASSLNLLRATATSVKASIVTIRTSLLVDQAVRREQQPVRPAGEDAVREVPARLARDGIEPLDA